MIIKRKYEKIGVLIERDSASKDLFFKAMSKQYDNQEQIVEHLNKISNVFIYNADMGICVERWDLIWEGLEMLDNTNPYDNGLTYNDVSEVLNVGSSRKGNAIELWMISRKAEMPTRIVDVVAIENKEHSVKTIEPWEVNYRIK